MRWLVPLLLFCVASAAFIETQACLSGRASKVFPKALVDVALDEEHHLLKFFVNTQVKEPLDDNVTDKLVVVSDVNSTTNLFTTLSVEITHQGKLVVSEDLRFCDILMVKKSAEFYDSPRFQQHSSSTGHSFPTGILHNSTNEPVFKRSSYDRHRPDMVPLLSESNATIESLFTNTTGQLVQCPLYNLDSLAFYYQVDVSHTQRNIGSYSARFTIISNDGTGLVLGCFQLYVTPVLADSLVDSLLIAVLALFIVTGTINFFTVIYSSYQESSNPFLFMASTICNRGLQRQLGATVQSITVYLQFAFFTGALNLQYPGFYQPLIASFRWCALLGFNFISGGETMLQHPDNVYFTFNVGGLETLTSYTTIKHTAVAWPNFMITLALWLVILVLVQQAFLVANYCVEWLRLKARWIQVVTGWKNFMSFRDFDTKRDLAFIAGQLVSHFMLLFGFPFLVLTSNLLYEAADINGHHKVPFNFRGVRDAAYLGTSSFKDLFGTLLKLDQDKEYYLSSSSTAALDAPKTTTLDRATLTDVPSIFTVPTQIAAGIATGTPESDPFGNQANLDHFNNTALYHPKAEKSFAKVSVAVVVFSTLLLCFWLGLACYLVFGYIFRITRWKITQNPRVKKLYTSVKTILIWSPFYHLYHPTKIYFVVINLFSVLLRLIIVGCLQRNGAIQVGALIVVEVAYIILHFGVWPFFINFSLWSTQTIIPPARLLVTLLCIPFIRDLNYSEDMRTRIAFVQFTVHLLVGVAFLVQLGHGLVITIGSIKKDRSLVQTSNMLVQPSYDSFAAAFDYQQPMLRAPHAAYKDDLQLETDDSCSELLYYRSGTIFEARPDDASSTILQHELRLKSTLLSQKQAESVTMGNVSVVESHSTPPPKTDYTFREADLIYRKYFTGDLVDPDIKAMWDARKIWDTKEHTNEKEVMESKPLMQKAPWPASKLYQYLVKKPPVERSFLVSRPRKLVVKQLEKIDTDSLMDTDSTSTK